MARIVYAITICFILFLHVAFRMELLTLPEQVDRFRNPGSFSTIVETSEENIFSEWNKSLREKIMHNTSTKQSGELLAGMILGGKGLDEEVREVFAKNGLAHLLSVSGTHLLLLVGFLKSSLKFLPKTMKCFVIFLVLCFYALLCGLKPPVLRALLMSSVFIFVEGKGKRGVLLCFVAMLLLSLKPWWLYNVGMQLSFGAAFSLVFFTEKCKRVLPLPESLEFLREPLAITCAAQLGVLPLLVYYFYEFSFIGFVSNIFLVPILELAALCSALGSLLACFLEGILPLAFIKEFFFAIADFLVQQILLQAQFLAKLSFSIIVVPILPMYCFVLYYALLIVWADMPLVLFFTKWERRTVLGVLMCCLFCHYFYVRLASKDLTVYFLDVGQGDCVVVETPQRKVLVYDTGGLKNYSTGSRILVPFLHSMGYGKVDCLFLSHYDYDHVGGAKSFLRNMKVERIVLPYELIQENNVELFHEMAEHFGEAEIINAKAFCGYEWDEGVKLECYIPKECVTGNEASTVLAIRSRYGDVLLTGDIGSEREQELLDIGEFAVLKAGHHGSRFSTSAEFLARVRPKFVVISCGLRNSYGHPHGETLARLEDVRARVLRTDVNGAVKVVLTREEVRAFDYANGGWQELPANSF